jgi:chromosomal replication initiation ATPase DnaA|tara:strand:- start:287 stop:601 length:315 start_codon:yes stop_codon:yes gene_type:complete
MKQKIFKYYALKISNEFNITLEEMFTQTKKGQIVDARQLLYYLCVKRNFKKNYIQTFTEEYGYIASHSTITYGVEQAKKLIASDPDFKNMINKIEESLNYIVND